MTIFMSFRRKEESQKMLRFTNDTLYFPPFFQGGDRGGKTKV